MQLPLISHPTRHEHPETYTEDQLTERGDLRLTAHNRVVSDRSVRLFSDRGETTEYIRAAAALHDFGKATPQFQAHVRPEETATCPDEETAHARLGALVTWYVLGELDAPDRDRLAGTLAVARHHQALPNAAQYTAETIARAFEEDDGAIQAQLEGIDETWSEAATELLEQTPLSNPDWNEFYPWAMSGNVSSELRELSARSTLGDYTLSRESLPQSLYDRTLRFWSALTLADKSHAMDIPEDWLFDLDTLDRETIEDYIAKIREGTPNNSLEADLNDERERARRQTVQGVHEWLADSGPQIATLTLPTGLGKTFTGLTAAFEARDILSDDKLEKPRPIIYALPFTSIIEQTRELFEEPDLWGADPQRSALTVHHYLSETVVHHDDYAETDTTETDEETAELLGEAWRDGTILTTFVQLFESLTGPTNRQGLKLPALESSLVILDEPQALPKDWWNGIVRLLDIMTEEYDARVIAMTATQPSLVRNLQTESLLETGQRHDSANCNHCEKGPTYADSLPPLSKDAYFRQAERVQYTIDSTALSRKRGADETHVGYDSAAERILEATHDGSTLAICNTIGSSRELTEVLKSRPGVTHIGGEIEAVLDEHNLSAIDPVLSTAEIVDQILSRVRRNKETDKSNDDMQCSEQNGPSKGDSGVHLLTLNSRFRPFDREILIEIADRLSTSDERFVLVSTQAIEAGVDLSFRTVFRDIAPLDSIVQAAGRCNRSYEWGRNGGQVIVWMLANPEVDTPYDPETEDPPAYYVYERGSTDGGIPGHLEIISEVLDSVPDQTDAADAALSQDAVASYFEALGEKSLWSGDLRKAIDNADAQWLGRQSLIGGVSTFDVLVGRTDADKTEIKRISDALANGNPEGYDRLQDASGLRVSLPKPVIEDAPRLPRLDKKDRSADGVQVFQFCGGSDLKYDLTVGGLQPTLNSISDQSSH